MGSFTNNFWIRLCRSYIGYIKKTYHIAQDIFSGKTGKSEKFPVLHVFLEEGPIHYKKAPTAIRAGRSIFTFLFSLISSYEKK